jgi:uncharacterized membrane protein SpoIIM required for sporulation/ABC-type transport system involved in multi-copper enzyme maturation permease subunit
VADLWQALIITRREVRDQFRDWRIIFPIIILTVFFPGLMNFTAAQAVRFVERYGADIIGERMIPFLLMIVGFFPISISLVIALESFVGEKERRSIEPLLSSPLENWQLYLGKLLASLVVPLMASYLGIFVYLFGVNRQVGYVPESALLIQILLLTAVEAILMVSAAVVISTQTTSVRAANLLASFIIIPMALLIQGVSLIMFWARYPVLWWIIVALLLIAGMMVRMGVAHFNREELLGRELDTLNFHWMGSTLVKGFVGEKQSLLGWLKHFYARFFPMLRWPILITGIALLGGFLTGILLGGRIVLPEGVLDTDNLAGGISQGLEVLPVFSVDGVFIVWLHNLRTLLLATLMGIFSFGVLGLLVVMLPMGIIGYFMTLVSGVGLSPALFLSAFVLPHGLLEIPAIMIAGAAIMRLGATLIAPNGDSTIGEAFLLALADWAKVLLFVVAPLLLGAAFIEVYLTPNIAVWLLNGF